MKTTSVIWIALGTLLLICTSCSPQRIYTSGSYGTLKSYTSKLPFEDEKKKATYVSASADFGKHPQENDLFRDKKFVFSADVHQAVSGKHYNYYYGIGAGAGSYKFERGLDDVIATAEKQSFYSIRAKAGINYTYTRPKVDYRFIGLEVSYVNEFGPYQDKLKEILRDAPQAIVVNPNS